MTLVFVKRRAELGSKKRFLFLRLSGETEENHDKAQNGAVLADGQGGATQVPNAEVAAVGFGGGIIGGAFLLTRV